VTTHLRPKQALTGHAGCPPQHPDHTGERLTAQHIGPQDDLGTVEGVGPFDLECNIDAVLGIQSIGHLELHSIR